MGRGGGRAFSFSAHSSPSASPSSSPSSSPSASSIGVSSPSSPSSSAASGWKHRRRFRPCCSRCGAQPGASASRLRLGAPRWEARRVGTAEPSSPGAAAASDGLAPDAAASPDELASDAAAPAKAAGSGVSGAVGAPDGAAVRCGQPGRHRRLAFLHTSHAVGGLRMSRSSRGRGGGASKLASSAQRAGSERVRTHVRVGPSVCTEFSARAWSLSPAATGAPAPCVVGATGKFIPVRGKVRDRSCCSRAVVPESVVQPVFAPGLAHERGLRSRGWVGRARAAAAQVWEYVRILRPQNAKFSLVPLPAPLGTA